MCSLPAVYVIVCVIHLTPTVSQCTTKYCTDDNNDNYVDALTAMVSRLQNTVERLERQHQEQEKQHQDSTEQLQQQFNDSLEQQRKRYQKSLDQLEQEFNDSMEQHQEYVIMLENTMKEKISTLEQDLRDLNKPCASDTTPATATTSAATPVTTSAATPSPSATDCADLKREGHSTSGVYDIRLVAADKTIKVYCDMTTDGGGWLVFQRRQDGSVNFSRDWAGYKEGFGDVSGEFWLGNEYLHAVTAQKQYTLRIDLEDFEGATRYAVYSSFAVADEDHKYRLSLGEYIGTAGNSLRRHAGMAFSATDRDNDLDSWHCAQRYHGGWWFWSCLHSNLNGEYLGGEHDLSGYGVDWYHWHGHKYSLKKVDMKLRP